MEFIVGITLAMFICGAAAGLGMDRDRVFYPVMLLVVATYYILFAIIDGGRSVLWAEMAIAALFIGLAVVGFKHDPWWVVVGLAGHGVMDSFHQALVQNAGVPLGWPGFCLTFDVTAAVLMAWVLVFRDQGRCSRFGLGRR